MAAATAVFRSSPQRAYRAVRERLGLVTATLAEDIAGMRVVQGVHARARERAALPRGEHDYRVREPRDRRHQRPLLPVRRLPLHGGHGRRPRLRRLPYFGRIDVTVGTLLAFMLYLSNFFDPVQQLSQLYNTFLAAVAALDKIMDVMDEEPEVEDEPGRGAPADPRPRLASTASGSATARAPRSCTASISTCRPARRSRSSGTRGREVDDREAARPLLRPARGRITIDGHDLRDITQE